MDLSNLKDQELIKLFLETQSSKAIEVLINRYKKQVFSYIFFQLRNEDIANDIFQETFFKVIKSLKTGKYFDENKLIAWIIRIAHNLIIDYYRSTKKIPITSNNKEDYDLFDLMKTKDYSIEKTMIKTQTHKKIKHLIHLLPKEQKEIIIMRHYMGMSFKEIADQLNISINTALGRMRYALINLRKIISKQNIDLLIN